MKRRPLARVLATSLLLAACNGVNVKEPPGMSPPAPEPTPAPAAVEPEASPPEAEPAPQPAPPPPEPPAALRALQFYAQLKQRPAREQHVEQERLRKTFAATRSDSDRMRLALALSVPGASSAEEAQALELLEPLVRTPGNEYYELASLLATLLGEQRRRGEEAAALQLKLERIKALEKEMQERSTGREQRWR